MERKETELENIVVKENPRTVLNNEPLEELTASIRTKGVLQPLLLKPLEGGKFELVAGSRRLKAAKAAGLKTVPYDIVSPQDEQEAAEMQLEENIHRVDLTPIEEGLAFRDYLERTKKSADFLAKKISKQTLYVERRLALVNLPKEIQDAINKGKMSMGHGLALARVQDPKKQKEILKEITEEKLSVHDALWRINRHHLDLSDAIFDKKGCQGCPHNGGEQAVLFETGAGLKGKCLNPACFQAKTQEFVQEKTMALQKQGIKVLSPAHLNTLQRKEFITTWEDDYKEIATKKLQKEPENYAIAFVPDSHGIPEKKIICTNPAARHKKQIAAEGAVRQREQKVKDRLKGKVDAYKRDFLIGVCAKKTAPVSKAVKVMALYGLLVARLRDRREEMKDLITQAGLKIPSYGETPTMLPKLWALGEADLDRHLSSASGLLFSEINFGDLLHSAGELQVKMEEEFQIDQAFLELHTKEQLSKLAKEIGLDIHMKNRGNEDWAKGKRPKLIDVFLKEGFDLKGKVPKAMGLPPPKKG